MVCPKGHDSVDTDFCSVCGAKIAAAPPAGNGEPCPDCGAVRHAAESAFCEDCGYNFATGEHGEPKSPPTVKTLPSVPEPPPPVLVEWEIAVSVDPALKAAESPEPPVEFQPSSMLLMGDSYLIGRRSDKRGVFPEISLDADDAVSHRHALLNRTPEGGLCLRDVGSSNGTRLNGSDVVPLTDIPLKDGDQLTVGHWTCIAVRRLG
jgi:hypothetical protein